LPDRGSLCNLAAANSGVEAGALGTGDRRGKRERILEAALAVFSRKGVFASRIADIASEAGIAYGLVYHYFKNKDEILNTIFDESWGSLAERLEQAEKRGETTPERLRSVAESFIEVYHARPQLVELLMLEFTLLSKLLEANHLEKVKDAFGVIRRIIERGQREGEIRGFDSGMLVLTFVGGLQLILQCQAFGFLRPPEGFNQRGADLVVQMFLNGVGAK
jgi:AcrR family transcriptional regulator